MLLLPAVTIAFVQVMQQDTVHRHAQSDMHDMQQQMLMVQFGPFNVMAMAQAIPTLTAGLPAQDGTALDHRGAYITQPALMAHTTNRGGSIALHTTLNVESITQPHGELSYGAWGEGFIDKRHPHTVLHELMLSWNRGTAAKGVSVSLGKGFAPYGTDDPMSRPAVKYPTNHHLSQVLERWVVSGVLAYRTWGLEAGVFAGNEPTGPYDLGNYEHFGNSWSARVTRRLGKVEMGRSPTEISLSYASVVETHDGASRHARLYNAALRQEHHHGAARAYALLEASRRTSNDDDSYFSVLAEGALSAGVHQPYLRAEFATRPEYAREGSAASDDVFRYDHDAAAVGATRWLALTGGYVLRPSQGVFSARPYVEAQYNRVRRERGLIDPLLIFGRTSFWSISAGVRILLGGEPMRMGTYGVLDPMRAMHEMAPMHHMSEHEH